MRNIYSHPGKLLINHLQEVSKKGIEVIQSKDIQFQHLKIDKNFLEKLIYIETAFHDFGKATVFFQKHLRSEPVKPELSQHAFISALLAYWLAKKFLEQYSFSGNEIKLLASLLFISVKRHHAMPDDIRNELEIEHQKENVHEQIKNFAPGTNELFQTLLQPLSINLDLHSFFEEIDLIFTEILDDVGFDLLDYWDELEDEDYKIDIFLLFQLLFSTLLYADKSDVIIEEKPHDTSIDIAGKIENFRKTNFATPQPHTINFYKEKAYRETLQNIDKTFDPKHFLYSITLPTGMGKTILSLAAANKIKQKTSDNGRLIINIPFTSIIDQNFEVYKKIFQTDDSRIILKHHYLSLKEYKTQEKIYDYDRSSFLIETWNSELVTSTFVQLLESLLKTDKSRLLKWPNILNSIIVLDEVQSIPYKYWYWIRKYIMAFARTFKTYFIFTTATQPLIFKPDEEIIELVPGYRQYFNLYSRTKLIIQKPETRENFIKNIQSTCNKADNDLMIILNTKNETRELFKILREDLTGDKDLFYMSTLITPYERKKIIHKIKQKSNKPKIIITTQLVEAGVDISVRTIYRQMAPLDAIIQAAGRANRYNEFSTPSNVYLFRVEEWKRKTNRVYGIGLINKTLNVLKTQNTNEILEPYYIRIVKNYFSEVQKDLAQNDTKAYWQAMLQLNFGHINHFQLIDDIPHESAFIAINEEARKLWNEFENIYSDENLSPFEKKKKFSHIKNRFYDYVINIPVKHNEETIAIDAEKPDWSPFYMVDPQISEYYHYDPEDFRQNTGYDPPSVNII